MAENQYEIYFADVLLRGEYPGYIKRFFKEKNIVLSITDEDKALLKNTADFMTFSYYTTYVSNAEIAHQFREITSVTRCYRKPRAGQLIR